MTPKTIKPSFFLYLKKLRNTMSTTNNTDYVQMKKQRALAKTDNLIHSRDASTITRNKRFSTATRTETIDEDGFTNFTDMYGVKAGACDISLALCDTSIANNNHSTMFSLSRRPMSFYRKEKSPNYLKYT